MKPGVILKIVRVLMVIGGSCAIAVFLFEMRAEPQRQEIIETVPVVQVMEILPENRAMQVQAFGTVTARKVVTLSAEVPGRIEYIHPMYKEGGRIRKGDLLISIDPRHYRLEVATAENQISQAVADIHRLEQEISNLKSTLVLSQESAALALKELNRQRALNKEAFTSRSRLDIAKQQDLNARMNLQTIENSLSLTKTVMQQKQAALGMARTGLDKAALALGKTEIRAEFNGLVLSKAADPGEFVASGQPLGSIYQEGALDVEVRIPLEKMKWLDPALLDGGMPEALISMAGDKNDGGWKGRVVRFKAAIDESTRTLPIILEIEAPDKPSVADIWLKPGAFVQCSIFGKHFNGLTVIPRHLLKQGNKVYTLKDERLEKRDVRVLRKFEDEVYIDEGLEKGDLVISTPLPNAVEGMKLRVDQIREQVSK